jgi:PIN domain nuclease of toxin-antitoxin system
MILDTCALLFLPSGDARLTPAARERLAGAASVFYCAISAFEIALKVRDKKLELPLPPARWVRAVADRYGLVEVPLDTNLCIAAATLPWFTATHATALSLPRRKSCGCRWSRLTRASKSTASK